MTVYVHVDISDPLRELDRLDAGPDLVDVIRFEAILAEQFQQTQRDVHVITGSLRRSGKVNSRLRDKNWHGEISYGGPAPGAEHSNVDYAQDEQFANVRPHRRNPFWPYPPGRTRLGYVTENHDFMRSLDWPGWDQRYTEAVADFLRGQT